MTSAAGRSGADRVQTGPVDGIRVVAALTRYEIVLVPVRRGALAVAHRPGRRSIPIWAGAGVTHVVTLLHEGEGAHSVGAAVRRAGMAWVWLPMQGAAVPDDSATVVLGAGLKDLCVEIGRGASVVVHCSAGIHRTGMIAYALLRMLDVDPSFAREIIAKSRAVTADGLVPTRIEWAESTARRHHRESSEQAAGSGHVGEASRWP